jgi:hypothetical protein
MPYSGLNHCRQSTPGVGQLIPCRVTAGNTGIAVPSSGPYRGVIVSMHGLATANDAALVPVTALTGGRLDSSGVSYSSASKTVTDPSTVSGDVGSSVSPGRVCPPLDIPVTSKIVSVVPGTSFTMDTFPTGSGTSVVVGANNNVPFFGVNGGFAFTQLLNNDGWVVITPPYMEDEYLTIPCLGVQNDMVHDSGFGARYLASTLLWFDHVRQFVNDHFGYWPIVPTGASWGGSHALQWAIHQPSQIAAFMACLPATLLENASVAFTQPSNFAPFNQTANGVSLAGVPNGLSGWDFGPTDLSGLTVPGAVVYGTIDSAAGWGSTTLAAGNTTDVSTFAGSGTLAVVDGTKIVAGGSSGILCQVATSNGIAFIGVGSVSGNNLNGLTTLHGSGVPTTGGAVNQSLTDQLITNAAAGKVTRMPNGTYGTITGSAQPHFFNLNDAQALAQWLAAVVDPNCPAVW